MTRHVPAGPCCHCGAQVEFWSGAGAYFDDHDSCHCMAARPTFNMRLGWLLGQHEVRTP